MYSKHLFYWLEKACSQAPKEAPMSRQSYSSSALALQMSRFSLGNQRRLFIGVILFMALLAFELFNFDTTQFALTNLLGEVRFLGILWATILAIAFCSIDFAGLFRLFTPQRGAGENKEVWYLMGAWLIGATMNAIMTWWAVSLTLLDHNLGNEVLSREQLLRYVPIFVAVLVWLTRILFIGAFSVTGEQFVERRPSTANSKRNAVQANGAAPGPTRSASPSRLKAAPASPPPASAARSEPAARPAAPQPPPPAASTPSATVGSSQGGRPSRVRQRPPIPNSDARRPPSGLQARGRS
jgi:hypothetical protein